MCLTRIFFPCSKRSEAAFPAMMVFDVASDTILYCAMVDIMQSKSLALECHLTMVDQMTRWISEFLLKTAKKRSTTQSWRSRMPRGYAWNEYMSQVGHFAERERERVQGSSWLVTMPPTYFPFWTVPKALPFWFSMRGAAHDIDSWHCLSSHSSQTLKLFQCFSHCSPFRQQKDSW